MAIGPLQSNVVYDASTVTNFKAWSANFISANLSAMGWTQTSDAGQVTWANITNTTHIPTNFVGPSYFSYSFRGAWSAPNSVNNTYHGSTSSGSATTQNDVVTFGGLTWQCVSNTQVNGGPITKVSAQTSLTLNISSTTQSGTQMTLNGSAGGSGGFGMTSRAIGAITVTNSSGGAGTGFMTIQITGVVGIGAATNGFVGYYFTTTAATSTFNNEVAVPCTASSESGGNSFITLQNGSAVAQAGAAGNIVSDFTGVCFHVTGFSNPGNNGYFVVTSSTSTTILFSNTAPGTANYAGVTETAAATAVSTTSMMTVLLNNSITNGGDGLQPSPASPSHGLNNFAGLTFTFANFTNSTNNGTFTVLASNPSAIVVTNASAVNAGVWINGSAQIGNAFMASSPSTVGVTYDQQQTPWGWFQPYHYEVWQTNDGNTPIILRINYSAKRTAATDWYPVIAIQLGYTSNGNGFLTGNQINGTAGNAAQLETIVFGNIASQSNITEVFECTMCGSGIAPSGAWLSMCMWRTNSSTASIMAIERTLNASGAAVDTSFTFLAFGNSHAALQQSVSKPGQGSQGPASSTAWAVPCFGPNPKLAYQGMNTILPVFPMIGYMANPMTAAVVVTASETLEGQLIQGSMYGTNHTFMVVQAGGTGMFTSNGGYAPAIRFEAA